LGDHDLLTEAEDVAISLTNATIKDGMDDDGSLFYEFDYKRNHLDADKHWWPQAEGLIGLTNTYQIAKNNLYLEKTLELWQFIKNRMVDKKNGEWYWKVDRAGVPYMAEDKVGFWKCPYHNSRACLEMIRRINLLIN